MNKQLLNEFEANLKRYAKAKDPRNISTIKKGIVNCLSDCNIDNKELLTKMFNTFRNIRNQHKDKVWKDVDEIMEKKVINTANLYFQNPKTAGKFLKDSPLDEIPLFLIKHLSVTHGISIKKIKVSVLEA